MPDFKNLQRLKVFFNKAYGRQLSDKEIEEIILNLTSFFELLAKHGQKDKEEKEA